MTRPTLGAQPEPVCRPSAPACMACARLKVQLGRLCHVPCSELCGCFERVSRLCSHRRAQRLQPDRARWERAALQGTQPGLAGCTDAWRLQVRRQLRSLGGPAPKAALDVNGCCQHQACSSARACPPRRRPSTPGAAQWQQHALGRCRRLHCHASPRSVPGAVQALAAGAAGIISADVRAHLLFCLAGAKQLLCSRPIIPKPLIV